MANKRRKSKEKKLPLSAKTVLLNSVVRLGLIGALVSLLSAFSYLHLWFDLLSNFRIQYIVLIFIALCVSLISRKYVALIVLMFCFGVHILEVAQSQWPVASTGVPDVRSIRVMTSNVHASNSNYQEKIDYVNDVKPDVVVILEYTHAWHSALSVGLEEYMHRVTFPSTGPFGIGLYSKLPVLESAEHILGANGRPSIDAVLAVGNQKIRVLGTHPPPPLGQEFFNERNQHLMNLASLVLSNDSPTVVLGDLNITPWSYFFKSFVEQGNLIDGRRGFGILPTWPVPIPLLQIPIDHIVVSEDIVVTTMEASDGLGSDHRAIWADIKF